MNAIDLRAREPPSSSLTCVPLTEYEFLKYAPLVVACAAMICTARAECPLRQQDVAQVLEQVGQLCDIQQEEINECAQALLKHHEFYYRYEFLPIAPDREPFVRSVTTTPTSVMHSLNDTVVSN